MKKVVICAGILAGIVVLAGCNDETHDIPYFKSHQDELKQTLAECQKQSRENWSDNCNNANEADVQIKNDKLFAPSKKG